MVSNIHTGDSTEQVLRNRRKPRLNEFNRKHVRLIWGDQHRKQLEIPKIINDYNHWMLGVDVVNQLIAYYRPKIRCRRTWVPIFLHCLDILRVNLYVLYKETSFNHPDVNNDTIRDHKHFLIEFVNSLIRRGNAETMCQPVVTRGVAATVRGDPSIVHKGTTGKIVMSRTKPSLSIFDEVRYSEGEHKMIPAGKQRQCKYCQYQVLVAKAKKEVPPVEQRPRMKCSICDVYLCPNHVAVFHRK